MFFDSFNFNDFFYNAKLNIKHDDESYEYKLSLQLMNNYRVIVDSNVHFPNGDGLITFIFTNDDIYKIDDSKKQNI